MKVVIIIVVVLIIMAACIAIAYPEIEEYNSVITQLRDACREQFHEGFTGQVWLDNEGGWCNVRGARVQIAYYN
jgi:hypothetical protein